MKVQRCVCRSTSWQMTGWILAFAFLGCSAEQRPSAVASSSSAALVAGYDASSEVLNLERGALERWRKGDPSGFLEISADETTYFDPMLERRIDGLPALNKYYESVRGQVAFDSGEMLNPHVEQVGEVAVLTFNYLSHGGNADGERWNCTEVYRRKTNGWRIIQTHWSLIKKS